MFFYIIALQEFDHLKSELFAKGKPELKKKILQAMIICQRKTIRGRVGHFLFCQDNADVILNPNSDMIE